MELITTINASTALETFRTGRSTSIDKALVFQYQSNLSPAYISFADAYYFDLGIMKKFQHFYLVCTWYNHTLSRDYRTVSQ